MLTLTLLIQITAALLGTLAFATPVWATCVRRPFPRWWDGFLFTATLGSIVLVTVVALFLQA